MATLDSLSKAVASGNRKDAKALTLQALEEGVRPGDLVDLALVPAMAEVGERFKNNEIFVPEMLIAARAMKEAMTVLEPWLLAAGVAPKYRALIGTVEGDLHDIGKNLVSVMWKGANVNVIDLGTNVPAARFIEAIREHKPQVVGLSALLTTTMPALAEAVAAIRASDAPPVKIVVGGAPINQHYADQIGADGYAPDAGAAVDKILELLGAN